MTYKNMVYSVFRLEVVSGDQAWFSFYCVSFLLSTQMNRKDAMVRARWRKLIGMIDDYDESSG